MPLSLVNDRTFCYNCNMYVSRTVISRGEKGIMVPCTLKDGMLSFETDLAALDLLLPVNEG